MRPHSGSIFLASSFSTPKQLIRLYMSKCCLCGYSGNLVNAHVIPEAFFREMRTDNNVPILISNTPNTFRKRSPIGVYDQDILCDKCELKFSAVDDYGVQVLLKQLHNLFLPVIQDNHIVAYQAENINQDLLLRFFIATLWRASVSTQPFYNRVKLGSLELIAKQTILNPDKPIPKQFSAVLSRWIVDEESLYVTKGLMDPFPEKPIGVNVYRFYFGEVVAHIKADSRPFPKSLRRFALLEQPNVMLITREASNSKDWAAMINTVKEAYKNYDEMQKTHQKKNV